MVRRGLFLLPRIDGCSREAIREALLRVAFRAPDLQEPVSDSGDVVSGKITVQCRSRTTENE
jgi:hypothetical protein